MTMLIAMTFHFWQVLAKSEGVLFSTFITEIRGALHEAMVSNAEIQEAVSCFSKLLAHSLSAYLYNQGHNRKCKVKKMFIKHLF